MAGPGACSDDDVRRRDARPVREAQAADRDGAGVTAAGAFAVAIATATPTATAPVQQLGDRAAGMQGRAPRGCRPR